MKLLICNHYVLSKECFVAFYFIIINDNMCFNSRGEILHYHTTQSISEKNKFIYVSNFYHNHLTDMTRPRTCYKIEETLEI